GGAQYLHGALRRDRGRGLSGFRPHVTAAWPDGGVAPARPRLSRQRHSEGTRWRARDRGRAHPARGHAIETQLARAFADSARAVPGPARLRRAAPAPRHERAGPWNDDLRGHLSPPPRTDESDRH